MQNSTTEQWLYESTKRETMKYINEGVWWKETNLEDPMSQFYYYGRGWGSTFLMLAPAEWLIIDSPILKGNRY